MVRTSAPPESLETIMTLRVELDRTRAFEIGYVPLGRRTLTPIAGGSFHGERLHGQVLEHGDDAALELVNGSRTVDLRALLRTVDGALIGARCRGRFEASEGTEFELLAGHPVDPSRYALHVGCRFECGDARYDWLNRIEGLGCGRFEDGHTTYRVVAPR